jgi:hypothetical protein
MSEFKISPQSFREKMTVPPKLKKQYDVAVKAGLRFMFDEGMREQTLKYMDGPELVPQKIGEGVAAVILLISQESNGTFPGELAIPVGVELIGHAVEVAEKAGVAVEPNDVAEGMAAFIENIFTAAGATLEQMQQMLGGMDSGEPTPDAGMPAQEA